MALFTTTDPLGPSQIQVSIVRNERTGCVVYLYKSNNIIRFDYVHMR